MTRVDIDNQESTKDSVGEFSPSESNQLGTLVTALCGWIPLSLGQHIRRFVYKVVLAHLGTAVQIDPDVELVCTKGIHIADKVRLKRSVRIGCYGKGSQIKIQRNSRIDRGVYIKTYHAGSVQIGENTYIGPYTCLAGNSIQIGENCLIASHSGIYATNHIFDDLSRPITEQGNSFKGIVIEDDCWLGSGVRVLDGVTIGRGSVVGAGAVVTKNLPPYSIAVGVPAKVISKRGQTVAIPKRV